MSGLARIEGNKARLLRVLLDGPDREYRYIPEMEEIKTRTFKYFEEDYRLRGLALDEVGTISDCFILYAIAHLGVANLENILLFLRAYKTLQPSLMIADPYDLEGYRSRIRRLFRVGYLYKTVIDEDTARLNRSQRADYIMETDIKVDMEEIDMENAMTYYSVSTFAYNLMRQRFQKKLPMDTLVAEKPLSECMGWLCAGYVGTKIATNCHFRGFLDRVLRTKQVGVAYMPCELKCSVGEDKYVVCVTPSYLYYDSRYMTPSDFKDIKAQKLNFIKNYLACRSSKAQAVVVVACQDNKDLEEMAELIYGVEALSPYLEHIYFTGEGILRRKEVKDSFLQIALTSDGFEIVDSKVEFLD